MEAITAWHSGDKTVTISSVFDYKGHKFFTHKQDKYWSVCHYPSGYMILDGIETRKQAIILSKEKITRVEKKNPGGVSLRLDGLPVINL